MKMLMNGEGILPPAKTGDAGFDLICDEDTYLMVGRPAYLATHTSIKLPAGHWGLILPRSSTGSKGIAVIPAVIDEGYTGPIYTFAYSMHDCVLVHKGDRIAQMVIMPLIVPEIEHTTEPLPRTDRGESGFGSTNEKHETS